MTIRNPSGIAGWGIRPVSAKIPNPTVRRTAKIAVGILSRSDVPMDLELMSILFVLLP